jgi:hypothetical protein
MTVLPLDSLRNDGSSQGASGVGSRYQSDAATFENLWSRFANACERNLDIVARTLNNTVGLGSGAITLLKKLHERCDSDDEHDDDDQPNQPTPHMHQT